MCSIGLGPNGSTVLGADKHHGTDVQEPRQEMGMQEEMAGSCRMCRLQGTYVGVRTESLGQGALTSMTV